MIEFQERGETREKYSERQACSSFGAPVPNFVYIEESACQFRAMNPSPIN